MKTILTLMALMSAIVAPNATINNLCEDTSVVKEYHQIDSVDYLLESMILVESNGDSLAVGDTHMSTPSIGLLQIRRVMVKEINRILRKQGSTMRYLYKDRWSATKSVEMYYIWKDFHHQESSNEIIARNWNGGTYGYKKRSTIQYWAKVKNNIKNAQSI
tara:strand:- start:820 stop:1299 length:480 start_codon:yes stop_codon:yes gene_type:complete